MIQDLFVYSCLSGCIQWILDLIYDIFSMKFRGYSFIY